VNEITDGETLFAWVVDVLRHGAGRNDAILLRHAHRLASSAKTPVPPPPLRESAGVRGKTPDQAETSAFHPAPIASLKGRGEDLLELARATAPTREIHAESIGQGNAFRLAASAWNPTVLQAIEGDLPYPIAVGVLTGASHISEDDATLAMIQGFAANLISAAVRLVPLGQSAGLAVLAALEPVIEQVAHETRDATLDDLGGACFRADLASMRHETQYTRLFRS